MNNSKNLPLTLLRSYVLTFFSCLRKSVLSACYVFAFFIALAAPAQNREITILAVNDMHASIDLFPQFAALVDSMRTVYPNLLLFSAGDNRTGNPVNDMHPEPSFPMTSLMNKVGFNLSALGNHEFDGQLNSLRNVVNRTTFRHVCANMYVHDTLRLHIDPYRIFEVNGIRIAVLGLIQQGAGGIPDTHPDNVKNVKFRSPLEVANQYAWLRYVSDVFILLVHDEYDKSVQYANQYPLADVLISGHSHTRVEGTEIHNTVLVTQADSHLKYVTHITLQLTDGKITGKQACLLDVSAFSRSDSGVQAMLDDFKNNETLHRVLTQALTDFENYEELGCLMADAIRAETNSDIALQNPGGVRMETCPKGPLTVNTVYQLDPFGNETWSYNLTGQEVLRLIEAACIAENNQPPYVSGITCEMELDRQQKIKKLNVKMADGTHLNPQHTYKVVMNSYLAAISKYEKADSGHSLFRTTADLTIDYLSKQPAVDYKGMKRIIIRNL
jgi:5'-nucleotidase